MRFLKYFLRFGIPRWLHFTMLFCIVSLASGIAMNNLVMSANGGKMPVMVRAEDILFTIGDPTFGVTTQLTAKDFAQSDRHTMLLPGMQYALLADRIPIGIHNVPHEYALAVHTIVPWTLQVVLYHDSIASIGDIFIWSGSVLFNVVLFSLVYCLFRSLINFFKES